MVPDLLPFTKHLLMPAQLPRAASLPPVCGGRCAASPDLRSTSERCGRQGKGLGLWLSWGARLCPFLSRRGAHIGLQLASTRHPGGLAGSYDDQYTGRCVFIGVLEVTARADGKCAVIACLLLYLDIIFALECTAGAQPHQVPSPRNR